MGLVSRLHDGEVERCSLKSVLQETWEELHQTRLESQRLTEACREAGELGRRVEELEGALKKSVPCEKHEGVCKDLQLCVQHERETQVVLSQHVASIQQLQGRYSDG